MYHVVENTPGYMPDTEAVCFRSRRAAEAYAASLARELREEGYHCSGSAREGSIYAEQSVNDLGRVIEILPCEDNCTDSI